MEIIRRSFTDFPADSGNCYERNLKEIQVWLNCICSRVTEDEYMIDVCQVEHVQAEQLNNETKLFTASQRIQTSCRKN